MKHEARTLIRPYQRALCRYLEGGPGAGVQAAWKLGRRAVALRLETLDVALIHEQALMDRVLTAGTAAARNQIIHRARAFFAAAIVPMEETHRSALETNDHLSRLNLRLNRRAQTLSSINRKLQKEIVRRHVVEASLRQSEQLSSRLLDQSQRMQEQMRLLSRRILSVQEEERKRISRELHDVIAQMLTGINVRLATLKKDAAANTRGLSRKISRTQRLVEKSVDVVHRFARELRPAVLDDLGLIPALHSFMKNFTEATGIRASLKAFAGLETLGMDRRTTLYRVAQEALTNVAQHAQANRVEVRIQKLPQAVRMQIRDDGITFDVERMWHARKHQHLGLLGMKERVEMVGGKFTIASAPGRGTTIQAVIPFRPGTREKACP